MESDELLHVKTIQGGTVTVIIKDNWVLGEGGYGKVVVALCQKYPSMPFALKVVKKD